MFLLLTRYHYWLDNISVIVKVFFRYDYPVLFVYSRQSSGFSVVQWR